MRLALPILLICAACTWSAAKAADDAAPDTTFVHVNVVPMDSERVLKDQTVVVSGGRIAAIGRGLKPPHGAQVIDGHGTAYLSPGLADMHIHSETRDDLAVYLANGVTRVLHMGGARSGFIDSTVPKANSGRIPAPHVYAGFLVDGNPDYNGFIIKTPAEARAIVGLARTNGYDFIKVYVGLAPDVFSALAEEGRKQGLPLVGHGVTAVRLERQLAEGQVLVAHAEEFFYTYFTPPGVEESDTPPDPARIPGAVALAKRYGATVTADLATYAAIAHQIGHPEVLAAYLARPESRYLSPADRLAWQSSSYVKKSARLEAKLAFLHKLLKAMADGGVPLVTGTDAPAVPGMLPGFSLHDDFALLEDAGLSRFQILSAATRTPGAFIQHTKGGEAFGEVVVGHRADLLLSADDPLQRLATLRKPLGVMVGGRWHDSAALKALLDDVDARYRRAAQTP